MRISTILIFLCLCSYLTNAQLVGHITNESGEDLAFVSIYVKGTSQGTASNMEGNYNLKLSPGNYDVVFQYLGYETITKSVVIKDGETQLDITMESSSVILNQVEISADAEDPAYEVIRQAQKKRKYYKDQVDAFSCRSYIKGSLMLDEVPTAFMGQKIDPGDIDPLLDSMGRGMVYLSESESNYYVRKPNDFKEVMISSRVSGNSYGYSFNNALGFNFSFYSNTLDFGRPIVSPIASNAMAFYRYKLLGTTYDEAGRMINRIQVIPKRTTDPVFHGEINIYEDTWNIASTRLAVTSSNVQNALVDTLRIIQTNVHLKDDIWMPFNKTAELKLKLLGFRVGGAFVGIFSDYDIDPQFSEKFFDRELFKVEESSNEKSSMYWDSIRPVPLIEMERIDYEKRDSLEVAQKNDTTKKETSSSFSMLSGFDYHNPNGNYNISVSNPLTNLDFNSVMGLNSVLEAGFRKHLNKRQQNETMLLLVNGFASYGFAEEKFRGSGHVRWRLRNLNETTLELFGGTYIADYNAEGAMSVGANSLYSIYRKKNYLKLFDQDVIGGGMSGRMPGIIGMTYELQGVYANRTALLNNSDYSIKKKDEEYLSNDPQNPLNEEKAFDNHHTTRFSVSLRYQPGVQYISYPNRRFYTISSYPFFEFNAEYGSTFSGTSPDANFLRLEGKIWDTYSLGVVGNMSWRAIGGMFPEDSKPQYFLDYKHFDGNQTIFGVPSQYTRSFFMMPYFKYSSNSAYFEGHVAHHFNGYILDKIPLIRKLGFRSIMTANVLLGEHKPYMEAVFGIENIGIQAARFLRVDFAWQFEEGGYDGFRFVIGAEMPFYKTHNSRFKPTSRSITVGL